MTIIKDGAHFKDSFGRTLMLRGVNLAGSSKVPYPNGATHIREGFFAHRDVSFVGRPFPLDEADEHFARLEAWGFTFLRLLVTWEAIEHAGPGQYDLAYLAYLAAVVDKAAEYGINVFIDLHQDVWSRFTGGDGAPGWTLEKIGFEMRNFNVTGAALVHQTVEGRYPRMEWANNYVKLACATMFTLFFAGNDFAPQTLIDGEPAQDYLQRHYLGAMQQVAKCLRDKANVLGYDAMNEPSKGFIGRSDLAVLEGTLKLGLSPTPYQAMLLGSGYAQEVAVWALDYLGWRKIGTQWIDPQGVRAWQAGVECIWRQNGIWDLDASGKPHLKHPDHFAKVDGKAVSFARDYALPFFKKFARSIREVDTDALIFIEFDAVGDDEIPELAPYETQHFVYAPHWYDFLTLISKRYFSHVGLDTINFRPVVGRQSVRASYAAQLKYLKDTAKNQLAGIPTIIGETGIPYDLNNGQAYRSNNFAAQAKAVDDYMQAIEANLLNVTIWNYTPDNSNQYGDNWNEEDLSIFSRDQQSEPQNINSGGRALNALVRPYASATVGTPIRMTYDVHSGDFEYIFRHEQFVDGPTELFVPNYQYPDGYTVEISDGEYERDVDRQRLYYYHSTSNITHRIMIRPTVRRAPQAKTLLKQGWRVGLILIGILGLLYWLQRQAENEKAA